MPTMISYTRKLEKSGLTRKQAEAQLEVMDSFMNDTYLRKDVMEGINRRFDQVDRRFEQVDARFERLEVRLDRLEHNLNLKLGAMTIAWVTLETALKIFA